MMARREKDVGVQHDDQATAARQARILRLLVKRTLALLNPNDIARDAAVAAFDSELNEEMGRG
jgi:hypothetical protein